MHGTPESRDPETSHEVGILQVLLIFAAGSMQGCTLRGVSTTGALAYFWVNISHICGHWIEANEEEKIINLTPMNRLQMLIFSKIFQ